MVRRQEMNDLKKHMKINVGDKKLLLLDQFFDKNGECRDVSTFNSEYLSKILIDLNEMMICNHNDKNHRARFMCHSCYHTIGNTKKATKCKHKNKSNHSKGMCKSCYHKSYYVNRSPGTDSK